MKETVTDILDTLNEMRKKMDLMQNTIDSQHAEISRLNRHYKTICKHCGIVVQPHSKRKRGSNAVVYDSRVKSLVVYLSVVQFLTYGRINALLKDLFSLEISEGSQNNWVNEAKL